MMGATYEVVMPSDYLHILNCICIYDVNKTFKCYNKGDVWRRAATRLTADVYSQILDNFWLRPTYRRPYYYIHNVNQRQTTTYTPYEDEDYTVNSRSNILTITKPIVPTNPRKTTGKISTLPPDIYPHSSYDINNANEGDLIQIYKWLKSDGTYSDTRDDDIIGYVRLSQTYQSGEFKTISVYTFLFNISGTDADTTDTSMSNNTGVISTYNLGVDAHNKNIVTGEGLPDSYISDSGESSLVEKGAGLRYGNTSTVRMEIRYGTDDRLFRLKKVYIDYIKAPQNIRLTQEQLDVTEDTSQMLEFPDYVCQEIINELVHIVMENITDQRLQTHPVVSQSIANPAQQQAPESAG